jgi:hypothetical protein
MIVPNVLIQKGHISPFLWNLSYYSIPGGLLFLQSRVSSSVRNHNDPIPLNQSRACNPHDTMTLKTGPEEHYFLNEGRDY